MESALIVTYSEKSAASVAEFLTARSVSDIAYAHSGGEARRILLEREFDLVIINAPLPDESGESLAHRTAVKGRSQVILAVKSEIYEMVSSVCEKDGILTVEKPMDAEVFRQALSLARSVAGRLQRALAENENLRHKIENIRINDRAKAILMSSCGMSENEAHRFIEKRAMDTRASKRAIGEKIIADYENGTEG